MLCVGGGWLGRFWLGSPFECGLRKRGLDCSERLGCLAGFKRFKRIERLFP